MKSQEPINQHKVHHSLIEPAEIVGIKLQWFGFIVAFGFVLFPMTSGSVLGFAFLGLLLWSIINFILRPLYRWDKDAIAILLQAISQDNYHQTGDDINGPSKTAYDSIQKPK